MTTPAGAVAPTTIVFGTDGWRARIAEDYTFENVRRCADGVGQYVVDQGAAAKSVVVAYDRRFASRTSHRPPPRCSWRATSRSSSRSAPCQPR